LKEKKKEKKDPSRLLTKSMIINFLLSETLQKMGESPKRL